MIFNLLIVDDEAPIRRGISQFVNWEHHDCRIAATASDGREAIEVLQQMQIHIVITDIRMPELDGLELSEYIRSHFPGIRIIILTGFADFKYAQAAIKHGVSDFIVKPIAKDKIIASVKKAQEEIITSSQRTDLKEAELLFLKEQLLQELTVSTDNTAILEKLKHYGITLEHYFVTAFQLLSDYDHMDSLKSLILRQTIPGCCYRYNNLLLFISFSAPDDRQASERLIPIYRDISAIMESLHGQMLSIGISRRHQHGEDFAAAASEAIRALSLNFYSDTNISIFSAHEDVTDHLMSTTETLKLYELETQIVSRDFETAVKTVHSIFNDLKANFVNAADVKNICIQIYYIGFRVLLKRGLKTPGDYIVQDITAAKHICRLEEIIDAFIRQLKLDLAGSRNTYCKIVCQAIGYISEQLQEPLHLKLIADELHVNSSYLSRVFKRETGQPITEYINLARIEKAKELLADSDNLTYEIAELVGYNDPAYFSSTFKKHTGLSPKEYRNIRYSQFP